ncbi:MAG: hypothetical protein IKL27_09435, partial [Oscillospiraceae bacterium]|nr:hypothetical protein [Oscillospiraceae bacterium]
GTGRAAVSRNKQDSTPFCEFLISDKKELTLDRLTYPTVKGQFSDILLSNILGYLSFYRIRILPVHWYHPFWL